MWGLFLVALHRLTTVASHVVEHRLGHAGSVVMAHGHQQLPCSMWDSRSCTRGQTHVLCISRQILNHWTTREVLCYKFWSVTLVKSGLPISSQAQKDACRIRPGLVWTSGYSFWTVVALHWVSLVVQWLKNPSATAGSIPGLERSSGERNGNPLQYSCLENPMDRGAWQATVHGVTNSRTRLSNWVTIKWASQLALVVKNLPANAGDVTDTGLIHGTGRSHGGGHGNPLQYSCPENPMDRGAWTLVG